MPLISQAYNLAAGNRWLLSIPIKMIDPNLSVDNFVFNLTSIELPEREIISTDFHLRGRPIPIPTGVTSDTQVVTCQYMLSSDWHQYRFLNTWYQMYANENFGVSGPVLDISLYLLSEYKQPMFYATFQGSWINTIGGVNMNYQDGYNEIQASFSFKYAYMNFDNFPDV